MFKSTILCYSSHHHSSQVCFLNYLLLLCDCHAIIRLSSDMTSEEFSMLTAALTSVVNPDGDQASCMSSGFNIQCAHTH